MKENIFFRCILHLYACLEARHFGTKLAIHMTHLVRHDTI